MTIVSLIGVAAVSAPAIGASKACRVKNTNTGVVKPTLQKAINKAKGGQTLTVRGTCHGTTTIGKNLTIRGIRRPGSGKPTLDGDDAGSVVTVPEGKRVRLEKLKITDGMADSGGGILNRGTLTLFKVKVVDNWAGFNGAGIDNARGDAVLKLTGATKVLRNDAGEVGGGISSNGRLVMKDSSSVFKNIVPEGGEGLGGGVWTQGPMVMKGSSSVRDNEAAEDGGGVYDASDALSMKGSSSITGNTASRGGGIFAETPRPGAICGGAGNVTANSPDDCFYVFP